MKLLLSCACGRRVIAERGGGGSVTCPYCGRDIDPTKSTGVIPPRPTPDLVQFAFTPGGTDYGETDVGWRIAACVKLAEAILTVFLLLLYPEIRRLPSERLLLIIALPLVFHVAVGAGLWHESRIAKWFEIVRLLLSIAYFAALIGVTRTLRRAPAAALWYIALAAIVTVGYLLLLERRNTRKHVSTGTALVIGGLLVIWAFWFIFPEWSYTIARAYREFHP